MNESGKSKKYFEKDGHLNDGGVSVYVDALKLHSEDRLDEQLLNHVEDCIECKRKIVQLAGLLREHSYDRFAPHPSLSEKTTDASKSYIYFRIAAGILLITGIAYILFFLLPEPNEIITEIEPKDRDEEIMPEEPYADTEIPEPDIPADDPDGRLYAANFEPSVTYESLVDIQYRSYGIQVHSPRIGEEVHGSIDFTWNIRYDGAMYLTILNNREIEVYTTELTTHTYHYDVNLDPGLYYWKLETDDDLLYTGKFIVPVLPN